MIQSLSILNLPPNTREQKGRNFSLKVGSEFRMDDKNLLLTGDNGVGKSTLLRAWHDSLKRNQAFRNGGNRSGKNPYDTFCFAFDGQLGRMSGDLGEEFSDDELLEPLENAFGNYFGGNITNFLGNNIPEANINQVISSLDEYLKDIRSRDMFDNRIERDRDEESTVFEVAQDEFCRALQLYAKKHKQPLQKVCGAAILMIKGTFHHFTTEVNAWGYLVPKFTANGLKDLEKAKIITLLDGESTTGGSLGERTLGVIESIPNSGGIIILDEPTNGLSAEKSKLVREKVLEVTGSQIFAASHNEKLIEAALTHPGWRVINLPLNK